MRSPRPFSAVDASHDPGLNASRSALKPRRLRAVQFTNKVRSVTFTRFWLYASLAHHRHSGGKVLRWPSGRHDTAVASVHDAGHHRSYTAHRPAVAPSALVSGRVGNRAPPEISTRQESIHRDRITYHKHLSMSFHVSCSSVSPRLLPHPRILNHARHRQAHRYRHSRSLRVLQVSLVPSSTLDHPTKAPRGNGCQIAVGDCRLQ